MKKDSLPPGTRVLVGFDTDYNSNTYEELIPYYYSPEEDNTLIGTVLDKPAGANTVWVAWDEDCADNLGVNHEEEVNCDIISLESDLSKFEEEFNQYSEQVKEKVKAAAKLLKEANKLAKKAHAKNLSDMYDAVLPLIDAMDASGWNTSSWGC